MTSHFQNEPSALIDDIYRAFDDVRREDGITLHEAEVVDEYGSDRERAAARKHDTDTRWQDVPDAEIEEHYSILTFLDRKGFRYYIPAYMVWSLKNYKTSRSRSSDSTIYALSFTYNPGFLLWTVGWRLMFDSAQRCAICQFLRFMVRHGDGHVDVEAAEGGLNGYWGQFCDDG